MAVNADNMQALGRCGAQIGIYSALMGCAKLVAFGPGRNIGVRLRVYIGVHANADGGNFASAETGSNPPPETMSEHSQLGQIAAISPRMSWLS
jgi:hypothetical protein